MSFSSSDLLDMDMQLNIPMKRGLQLRTKVEFPAQAREDSPTTIARVIAEEKKEEKKAAADFDFGLEDIDISAAIKKKGLRGF